MDQKQRFLDTEGDAWLARNSKAVEEQDPVIGGMNYLRYCPRSVVEIGCGSGWRIAKIHEQSGAQCRGIDPASQAQRVSTAGIEITVGTAERLPYADASADLLIFGFCLYLTDPVDHFRIAAEADRVLSDGGLLVVYDCAPGRPYRNAYSHYPGMFSSKMDYAELFLAHPSYRRLHRAYAEHGANFAFTPDEAVAADFLLKDSGSAFPLRSA